MYVYIVISSIAVIAAYNVSVLYITSKLLQNVPIFRSFPTGAAQVALKRLHPGYFKGQARGGQSPPEMEHAPYV